MRSSPWRPVAPATTAHRSWRSASGQSAVEVVAVVPLLVALGFVVFSVLAAGAAKEAAAAAAQAGAMALLQDADVEDAAKRTLGAADAGRADVVVRGRRVTVTVRPRSLGPAAPFLAATSFADAGTGVPAATPSRTTVRGGDGKGSR